MARRNAAREAALQQAKERERAAGKKVSRIEAAGVNIAKSKFDPRVGAKNLESMSTRELRAHTARVEQFVSRQTQFVAAFAGSPVPRHMWTEYQRLEAINNANAARVMQNLGGVKLAGQDLTIEGREEMLRPARQERNRAHNQGRIFQHIERDLATIEGAEGVQRLLDLMGKKARSDYRERTVRARLNSGEGALKNAGFGDLEAEVEALSLDQKELLVDHSTFFDIAVENMVGSPPKSEVKEIRDAWYEEHEGSSKSEEVYNNLREQLDWVKRVAPRNPRDENGRFMKRSEYIRQMLEEQNEG